jgi:predicted flap endonuclease-1-like 5' DNA nuclease
MRSLAWFLLGLFLGLWLKEWVKGPEFRSESADTEGPDALTEITGIGPVFEQALRGIGITSARQLAAQTADSLSEALDGRVTADRIRRERWIEQAQERARG